MSDTSKREELIRALAADVHDEYGWLSDAQTARLQWDATTQAVHFHGEGSLDVGHIVAIAEETVEQVHTPTDDERGDMIAWLLREHTNDMSPMGRDYTDAEIADALRRTVQGEPSDAQAWAAARAVADLRKRETGAPAWFNVDHARAALRAAFQEGENR